MPHSFPGSSTSSELYMPAEQEDSQVQGPSAEAGPKANERLEREQRLVGWLKGPPWQKLQLLGLSQTFIGAVSIPTAVSLACLDFGCNVTMGMPLWSSISYVLTGLLALALLCGPRRAVKMQALMVLNLLTLVLAGCVALLFSLQVKKEQELFTPYQRRGMLVMKATAIVLNCLSLLTSILTLLLLACRKPWRPLRIQALYQELHEEAEDLEGTDVIHVEAK
ncbi:transmembrane protein 253 isoform X1 [Pleurodeles waltl]|uniref:transmembrane protein 253 isoform X1 n=1 Tax=Pleurodeles waltl TaxID=8319 RepID=UPI003709ABEC